MKHPMTSFGLVALLASLSLPASIRAQDSRSVPDSSPAIRTPDSYEAIRLLYLADGSVLRARARLTGAGWEILENKTSWNALPEGLVVRAILEREALADARRLELEIATGPRKEQNTRRVGLADWMLRQGLTAEAMGQLDRVLSSDPDQPQALQLMARLAPKVGIAAIDDAMASDEPTIGVLRAAANATPTVREIAIQRLGFGGPTDELRAELRAQLASHSPRLRALAAFALRRIYPGKSLRVDDVKQLISRSVLDGADEVRVEAARALRDVRDPSVAGPALKALSSSNARVRENSIEALGVMGYPASVEPLMTYLSRVNTAIQSGKPGGVAGGSIFIGTQTAYVQDFDVEVAQFQAVADPQINILIEGSVLDGRVLGSYTVSFATEARLVRGALGDITGVDAGSSNRSWLSWWESNKAQWTTPPAGGTATSATPKKDD